MRKEPGAMDEVIQALSELQSAVVLPHISIDGDCLGSAEAMRRLLRRIGVEAAIYVDKEPPANLRFLCSDYTVFSPEAPLPAFDGCVCVDCGDLGRLGDRKAFLEHARMTVNVDHHITNTRFAKVNFVDPDASSTGEIMATLYKTMGQPFEDATVSLYTAMFTDTGGFRFSNTSPETMRLAAELMEAGADPAAISTRIYDTESLAKLKLTARAIESIELYHGGKLAIIALTMDDIASMGAVEDDTDGFSALARSIEGVEVGAFIKQTPTAFKVSLRSKTKVNVAEIAQSFGGGGHIRASGYAFHGTLDEAKKTLVEKVSL